LVVAVLVVDQQTVLAKVAVVLVVIALQLAML